MTYLTAIKRVMKTFVIPTIIVFSTAYECKNTDNNTIKVEVEDTRPTCADRLKEVPKVEMVFPNLNLRYDLFLYVCEYTRWYQPEYALYNYDINTELAFAHMINTLNYSGSITSFNQIYSDYAMFNYQSEAAPSIEVTMSGIECKGSTKKKFAKDEVLGSTLYNCDPYLIDLASFTYNIKSVTTMHGMQLIWSGTISSTDGVGLICITIDKYAMVHPFETRAVVSTRVANTKSKNSNTQAAMRYSKIDIDTRAGAPEYRVVENSVPEGVMIGDVRKSTEKIVVSPNLLKGIYVGGKLDETKGWNVPELFEIL